MPAIHHARPVFARELPSASPHPPKVHMGVRFHSGPAPAVAACGSSMKDLRSVGSPFRGMFDPAIFCAVCGDALDRFAEVPQPTG